MRNNLENNVSRSPLTLVFLILLALQAVMELVIGGGMLADFQLSVEMGFNLTYVSDMDIFGIALGLQLILLTVMLIFSIIWTNQGNKAGPIVGIAAGMYFLAFGIMAFAKFGDPQPIYVDSIRGLITVIMGYMVYKGMKK